MKRRYMFMKINCPMELYAPARGLYTCILTIIFKHPGKSKPNFIWSIVREGVVVKVCQVQGHVTEIAAINSKMNLLLQNQKVYDF